MKLPKARLQELATEWRAARRVYPVYAAALKTFDLGLGLCAALESPIDRQDEQSLAEVRGWLQEMDWRCSAAQLRQIIQNSNLGTEQCLRALIQRYLAKSDRTPEDRYKLDFLLVQYFAQCASRSVSLGKVDLQDVAQVLEPVLGECPLTIPRFLEPLTALIERIHACNALRDLIKYEVLESGRKLKDEAGDMYFGSSVLVSFARYNFVLRRAFVRLLHADVEVIRTGLRELERSGIAHVDCSSGGFSSAEPIPDLWQYCQSWRKAFVADYASGPSFGSIADIRRAVESALEAKKAAEKLKEQKASAPPPLPIPLERKAPATPVKSVAAEVTKIEDARARVESGLAGKPVAQKASAPEAKVPATTKEHQPQAPLAAPPKSAEAKAAAVATKAVPIAAKTVSTVQQTSNVPEMKVAATSKAQQAPAPLAPASSSPVKPVEKKASASPVTPAPPVQKSSAIDVQGALAHIAKQVAAAKQKKGAAATTVELGGSQVVLSVWELVAFTKSDAISLALQRAVVARTLVVHASELQKKSGKAPELPSALELGQAVVAEMKVLIAQARVASNVNDAVNMAASSKRLTTVMGEAERCLTVSK